MPSRKVENSPNRQRELRTWLETEVLEGRFKPGDRIDERTICDQFGVSRTPVREALLQLSSLDLVEFRPRYGAVVRQMSVKEIAAMWEVLTSLEELAAGLAARRMTPANHQELMAIHEATKEQVAEGNISGYDASNKRFHEIIYAGSRNEYLAGQALSIRRRLHFYRRYPFQRAGGLERSFTGHQAVVDAIVNGDDKAAAAAMHDHVSSAFSFLDLVAELGDDPTPQRADGKVR